MKYLSRTYDPWSPLAGLRHDLDSVFDSFLTPAAGGARPDLDRAWAPAYEIAEEEGHYLVSLEMPGIPKDEIKIEVADNVVTVSGERKVKTEKQEGSARYGERRYGKFLRSFTIPAGVDTSKIEADYQDGVLTLAVPKAESARPRQIKLGDRTSFFGKLLGESRKREEEKPSTTQASVA